MGENPLSFEGFLKMTGGLPGFYPQLLAADQPSYLLLPNVPLLSIQSTRNYLPETTVCVENSPNISKNPEICHMGQNLCFKV